MRWLLFAAAVVVAGTGTWGVVANLPETATASARSFIDVPAHQLESLHHPIVKGIAFEGTRGQPLPLSELRTLLGAKVGEPLDDKQLAADRKALETELGERGFLAAKVSEPVITRANGGAYVVFDIVRGPMFHLRSVTVSGPSQRDASLANVVTISAGDQAIQSRIAHARTSLETSLVRYGKPATVDLVMHSDRDAAAVDVELVTR